MVVVSLWWLFLHTEDIGVRCDVKTVPLYFTDLHVTFSKRLHTNSEKHRVVSDS